MVKTKVGLKLMTTCVISNKSKSSVLAKFRWLKIHKMRTSIFGVSARLRPVIRGIMNYYCKFWTGHTNGLWFQLNSRLIKWVKWEKGLSTRSAIRWLKNKFKGQPDLFPHWALVSPWYLYLCDWTWRAVWIERFTYGSVRTQGWNSLAWLDCSTFDQTKLKKI